MKKTVKLFLILAMTVLSIPAMEPVQAAENYVKQGSFENDINSHWAFYQNGSSSREFEYFRSYDAPYGYGSYSGAIEAQGSPEDAFNAILSTRPENNSFGVEAGYDYFLVFFAKASRPLSLTSYLQRASDYEPISPFYSRSVTTSWQKFVISVSPGASSQSLLAFVVGDMPDGSVLYLDGVQFFRQNIEVRTREIRGKAGSPARFLTVRGIDNFDLEDVEIELPYYNNLSLNIETRRFQPERITSSGIYFNMPEQTFSGIGRVYLAGNYAGDFNYRVISQVDGIHPVLVRADSDLVVSGSGFSPVEGQVYLVVRVIDSAGQTSQRWIEPKLIDSDLSRMTFDLPTGIVGGNLFVQTSYSDTNGNNQVVKSNEFSYKLKPIVYATNWSERGYEHVGDKLMIYGRGLGRNPSVAFYDQEGGKLETKSANIVEIREDVELIEVATTKKSNTFRVVVVSEGIESEMMESFSYVAKPKINAVNSQFSRKMNGSDETIPAAKIGGAITVRGEGFQSVDPDVQVEFQGVSESRILANVNPDDIGRDGKSLKVEVPAGAVNGYLNVIVNGTGSNYLPLEIIPTVISVNPDPIVPGENITIRANGVNRNLSLTKVHFKLNNSETEIVNPEAINPGPDYVDIIVRAPLALSNNDSKVGLQYDRWTDDASVVLNVQPTITSASINLDNDILSIKGYGFSISPKENKITYMYADQDHTVIEPNVKILGVYPSEEGQEIRVKINDHYYYGYVTVEVDGQASNEANFGPAVVSDIARRVEFVPASGRVRGVLYISGYNFGSEGAVYVGNVEAEIHYRSNFFIIAVVDEQYIHNNPVVVSREGSVQPPAGDTTPPVITLNGDNPYYLPLGTMYVDPGATAYDETDGDLSGDLEMAHNVNFFFPGTYTAEYTVSDSAGNTSSAIRTVIVN